MNISYQFFNMCTSLLSTPLLSCPKCSNLSSITVAIYHQSIFSRYCCCVTLIRKKFYKCIPCPPNQTSPDIYGFKKCFPINHKSTKTHQRFSDFFSEDANPTNQFMDVTVNDDINVNDDNDVSNDCDVLSFTSTLSNDDIFYYRKYYGTQSFFPSNISVQRGTRFVFDGLNTKIQ